MVVGLYFRFERLLPEASIRVAAADGVCVCKILVDTDCYFFVFKGVVCFFWWPLVGFNGGVEELEKEKKMVHTRFYKSYQICAS